MILLVTLRAGVLFLDRPSRSGDFAWVLGWFVIVQLPLSVHSRDSRHWTSKRP
jgi:hypothetical protein